MRQTGFAVAVEKWTCYSGTERKVWLVLLGQRGTRDWWQGVFCSHWYSNQKNTSIFISAWVFMSVVWQARARRISSPLFNCKAWWLPGQCLLTPSKHPLYGDHNRLTHTQTSYYWCHCWGFWRLKTHHTKFLSGPVMLHQENNRRRFIIGNSWYSRTNSCPRFNIHCI